MYMKQGSRATEGALASLHGVFALHLMEKLTRGEISASDLNVIRQFLKDNNINCVGEQNDTLKQMAEAMPAFSFEGEEFDNG